MNVLEYNRGPLAQKGLESLGVEYSPTLLLVLQLMDEVLQPEHRHQLPPLLQTEELVHRLQEQVVIAHQGNPDKLHNRLLPIAEESLVEEFRQKHPLNLAAHLYQNLEAEFPTEVAE